MDDTRFDEAFLPNGTAFPFAICPKCNTTQNAPILDERLHTLSLVCPQCRNKFCSYCGGDRHYLVSCRKPLPVIRKNVVDRA